MNTHNKTPAGRLDEERLKNSEEAARWVERLKGGSEPHPEFFSWLQESPRHVEDTLFVLATMGQLKELTPAARQQIEARLDAQTARKGQNILPLPRATATSRMPMRQRRNKTRSRVALAAGLTALALTGGWLGNQLLTRNIYITAIGEQRALELADGSIVHLNTGTRLKVEFSDRARELRLLQGEALFIVKQDAIRPFRVHTDEAVIQALGTQFNVYLSSGGTKVAVLEGVVRVEGGSAQSTRLTAGDRAVVRTGGRLTHSTAPEAVTQTVAWRQRRLVFENETLSTIANEFNRYNRAPAIRIDPALSERRFAGSFDADAPESLAQALATDETLIIERRPREILIRPR